MVKLDENERDAFFRVIGFNPSNPLWCYGAVLDLDGLDDPNAVIGYGIWDVRAPTSGGRVLIDDEWHVVPNLGTLVIVAKGNYITRQVHAGVV